MYKVTKYKYYYKITVDFLDFIYVFKVPYETVIKYKNQRIHYSGFTSVYLKDDKIDEINNINSDFNHILDKIKYYLYNFNKNKIIKETLKDLKYLNASRNQINSQILNLEKTKLILEQTESIDKNSIKEYENYIKETSLIKDKHLL